MREVGNRMSRAMTSVIVILIASDLPSAFAFDLFGFSVYTFPLGVAGARSFPDPFEGTETGLFGGPAPINDQQ